MAGDWIKMQHGLSEKPEVVALASRLGIDRFSVIGRLHRIWSWFDQHTSDGCAPGVTPAFLDSLVSLDGFASALENVGWLHVRNGSITQPHFERHNGKSAKVRALASERMKRSRCAPNVTKPSPEKRREEKNKKESKPKKDMPPTIEQVRAYCTERRNGIDPEAFMAHYEANGWVQGRGKGRPIHDWRAAVRTWEANRKQAPAVSRVATDDDLKNWNPIDGGLGIQA